MAEKRLAGLVKELFGTSAELAVTPESVAVVRPSEAVGDTLSATVRALSRAGTVSRVLSADIPSLNGKPRTAGAIPWRGPGRC